jgi:hypothetical protein
VSNGVRRFWRNTAAAPREIPKSCATLFESIVEGAAGLHNYVEVVDDWVN